MTGRDHLLGWLRARLGAVLVPAVDYLGLYAARVVAQSADLATVDLRPDDVRLPSMARVPLRLGLPGAQIQVAPGSEVLLGWSGGDARYPYAQAWPSAAPALKIVIAGAEVYLGAEVGAEPLVRRSEFNAHVHASGALVAPPGGGAVTGATATTTAVTGTLKARGA